MSNPQTLNHYRILGPLGKGGMGEVFAAEDTRLHRKVAIKVLSALMAADPERRERFQREAQAVAALNHPNIVTIHSVEEADGLPFLTMELVEGKPLGEMMTAGGLPVDALLRVGIGVSDAMSAAHQAGITHRDLKPGNIMVTPDGRVKVLDFGLAKLREVQAEVTANDVTRMPASDLTGEGRIIGTVAYMSPEQAEGKPVDQRSDIFSLGVVLHELATGEKPFKGDTNVSVISAILKDTPRPITDLNPSLPADLARVIRRSLAKDPSRRYQTATDLRNELEDLKQELDSSINRSGIVERPDLRRGVDPLKGLAIGGLVMVLLAAGAFGYSLWKNRGVTPAEGRFEIDRLSRLTNTGNASLAAVSPDGRYVAHVKNDAGQPALWMRQTATTSDVPIVPAAPVRYDGVTYSPDGDYVYYVTYALTGGVGTLYRIAALGGAPQKVLEDVDSRISFSPDRARFTFTRGAPAAGTSWVMIANADGSEVRKLAALDPPDQFLLNGPGWSPDGRTIVAPAQTRREGTHSVVVAIDVESGAKTMLPHRWNGVGDLEWFPDGRSFVMAAAEYGPNSVQLWQITYPGDQRRKLTNDLNNYVSLSLSADAKSLAAVQAETVANLWVAPVANLSAAVQLTRGPNRGDGLGGIDWTPDGRVVYGSSASGRPQIWISKDDGSEVRELTTEADPAFAPSVTPDGRYIAFQRFSAGRIQIWRMKADGTEQTRITTGALDLSPVAAPDGFIYYNTPSAGAPRTFKVPIEGGSPVSLGDHYFRPTDISKDGTQLLGVGWDTQERRSSLAIMPVAGGPPHLVREVRAFVGGWGPDGRSITYPLPDKGNTRLLSYSPATGRTETIGTVAGNLFGASWAPDGKRLAMARGETTSDVVLITLTMR